jgi:hypothetical protein
MGVGYRDNLFINKVKSSFAKASRKCFNFKEIMAQSFVNEDELYVPEDIIKEPGFVVE